MLLGIDIGTTKTAVVLTDFDRQVHAVASRAHDAGRPGETGCAEQDVGRHVETVRQLVRELPAVMRTRVRAIGLTGQMHGVLVFDGTGAPLTPLVTWQDQRCLSEPQFLANLNARTGYALRSGYGCATLCWLSTAPQKRLTHQAALSSASRSALAKTLSKTEREALESAA